MKRPWQVCAAVLGVNFKLSLEELNLYMNYCKILKISDAPDYNYLANLLKMSTRKQSIITLDKPNVRLFI